MRCIFLEQEFYPTLFTFWKRTTLPAANMARCVLAVLIVICLVVQTAADKRGNTRELPTYDSHPCLRKCEIGRPQNCYYDFTLEYYFTLSKACYDCPHNKTDCYRPHCIPADGAPRGILVANRMMPGPPIHVCEGDTVIVRVVNDLVGAEGTSIHWHGIHQRGSQFMDGVSMLTQCPITQKSSFEYRFNASNPGTHFWHAHSGLQRSDGLFGALVVRQADEFEAHLGLYEEDSPQHTLIVNDWLSELSVNRFAHHHQAGGDNKPESMLINGKGVYQEFFNNNDNTTKYTPVEVFHVKQGTRYRFRTISNGILNCPIQISIDNHNLTMIASDGNPFKATDVSSFNIFAGERFDFVLNASLPVGNYWIRARGLADCQVKQAKQVAILRYQGAPDTDPVGTITWADADRQGKKLNPWNKAATEDLIPMSSLINLQPRESYPAFKTVPDKKFYLAMDFNKIDNYLFHDAAYYPIRAVDKNKHLYMPQVNHVTNKLPTSPPLSQLKNIQQDEFCHHPYWSNKNCTEEFCECTHVLQVALGDDVELVLIDEGVTFNANHPMHLHGHSFYVVGMDRLAESTSIEEVKRLDLEGRLHRNLTHAVAKDTITVPDGGYSIVRFKANNPGFWFLHCHIEFHADIGMGVFIQSGSPADMPAPPRNFPRCGSWAYSGEEEEEDQSSGNKCTNGVSFSSVTMLTLYLMVAIAHMVKG